MSLRAAGWWMVGALVLASSAALAQSPPARPKGTVVPASAPPVVPMTHGPVIAPAKPMIAPHISTGGDAGAAPSASRADAASARRVAVNARQSAEKTIAALVAAMKDVPRKPDPPPGAARAVSPRRAAARPANAEGPAPIDYRVPWPERPAEPAAVARRLELAWPDTSAAGPIVLHWDPSQSR